MRRPILIVTATALVLALAGPGCRLIDQRTFERAGLFAPPPQFAGGDFAGAARPPAPLAVVRFGTNETGWEAPLLAATRAAQARKAGVQFDVVAPIPVAAPLDVQTRAARDGGSDTAEVARVLLADGIAAEAVHLGQRGDAGNPPRQVEVYIR